jgi:hypothetical protein
MRDPDVRDWTEVRDARDFGPRGEGLREGWERGRERAFWARERDADLVPRGDEREVAHGRAHARPYRPAEYDPALYERDAWAAATARDYRDRPHYDDLPPARPFRASWGRPRPRGSRGRAAWMR